MSTDNKPDRDDRGKGAGQPVKKEKGDERRDNPPHSGPTRPGGSSKGKPGSDSNEESDK